MTCLGHAGRGDFRLHGHLQKINQWQSAERPIPLTGNGLPTPMLLWVHPQPQGVCTDSLLSSPGPATVTLMLAVSG